MKIIRSVKAMQKLARQLAGSGKTIGLVPTMGFLHEGHLSLINRAKKEANIVITTIFVNPTQFAPTEDLSTYPRNEKKDLVSIKNAGGDIVFLPKAQEIYPGDFQTWVTVEKLTQSLEGKSRPNHFRGVATIVAKLFNITRPDVVVFGQKDFQQAIVLRQMTRDLGFPLKFIIAPTVREKDGLAMSSRNSYFTPDQRPEAVCLIEALRLAKKMTGGGERSCRKIETAMKKRILDVCPSAQIDYISFNDFDSLKTLKRIQRKTICSLAVRVYKVRLIDNIKLV